MKRSVAVASGSRDTQSFSPGEVAVISDRIKGRGLTILDVIRSLHRGGFRAEAENLLFLVKLRVSGDYLQTSAVVRDGRVVSAVNDPNDYTGPGTGYRLTEARRKELAAIRDVLTREEVLRAEAAAEEGEARAVRYNDMGPARAGTDPGEVVVGLSPGFGTRIFRTLAGHRLSAVMRAIGAGVARGGGRMRVVRLRHTADTSFLGLSAARLSGSGIGIGLQSKGTAVIHQKDRLPHNNLELFSNAPITTLAHYEGMGLNAATYARGGLPEPVVVATNGEALGARFHARVALTYAIETAMTENGASPEEVRIEFVDRNT
jgi:propanediol dehydratase large subunit